MTRALALVLFLGMTSCSVRMGAGPGSEMRPASAAPDTQARAAPTKVLRKRTRVARPAPSQPASPAATTNDSSVAQICVDEINRYRATLGLRALTRAPENEGCANGQIRDDAQSGKWHGSFGRCGESLQNECMSSPTGQADFIKGCLKNMWNEGPGGGHYEAMKNGSATKVWCGFYTAPNGDVWSVQDFR